MRFLSTFNVCLFLLSITVQADDSTPAPDPDQETNGGLAGLEQLAAIFEPQDVPQCVTTLGNSQAFALPSCDVLDIWGSYMMTSARYPFVEVRKESSWSINYSSYSTQAYANQQVVNPVNGLVGVLSASTPFAQPQTICDQSTVYLLRVLEGNTDGFNQLNSALPNGFFSGGVGIRSADCTSNKKFGLQVLQALDLYQKDCFAVCLRRDGAFTTCGFRKGLGRFNQILNDFGGSSNAMSRLRTCPSAGWFSSTASQSVTKVFQMCSSAVSCAIVCSGDVANGLSRQAQYQSITDIIANKLSPAEIDIFSSPTLISQFLKPFVLVSTLMSQSDDFAASGLDDAWQYADVLTNPSTGSCKMYDQTMTELLQATGNDLSPLSKYQPSSSLVQMAALRTAAGRICLEAANTLQTFCNSRSYSGLCARADDPEVSTKGSFQSCEDYGLLKYYKNVLEYNSKCVPLGLPERATNGPVRKYLLEREGSKIYMSDCFPDGATVLWVYVGIGVIMWIIMLAMLIYGRYSGTRWLASSDVTMDVCRSRSFSVAGTLWLLYTFYSFYNGYLNQVSLKVCKGGLCSFYFPVALYLFLTSFIWVAAFGWLMVGNNPYRPYGALWSLLGVLLSHGLTFAVVYRNFDELDRSWDSKYVLYAKSYQIALICALQLGVDITYAIFLCIRPGLGMESFQEYRNKSHYEYIQSILDHPAGEAVSNKYGDQIRVFLTCADTNGTSIPKAKDIAKALSGITERSEECFIVVRVQHEAVNNHHLKRGQQLGLELVDCRIFKAEVIIAKQCLSIKDEVTRSVLLTDEASKADQEGRREDSARLQAKLVYCKKPIPAAGTLDLFQLIDGLKSVVFINALHSDSAELYWKSTLCALREFVRITGNKTANRSSVDTRERFRAAATEVGIPMLYVDVACSLPEDELLRYASIFLVGTESQQQSMAPSIERVSKDILHQSRLNLISELERPEFLQWLEQGQIVRSEPRHFQNPFSVANSCLDAFHFEHFKEEKKGSEYRTVSSSQKILKDLSSKVHGREFGPRQDHVLGFVLGLSTNPDTFSSSDWTLVRFGEPAPAPRAMINTTFIPSFLFICVGIAAIITSLQFVYSMASALQYRDLLDTGVDAIKDIQSFVSNFGSAALDLAGCVEPKTLQTLKNLDTKKLAKEMATWPPLIDAMNGAARSPALMDVFIGAIGGVVNAMLEDPNPLRGPIARNEAIQQVVRGLPGGVASALGPELINLTRPEVMATFPVIGSTVACMASQLTSLSLEKALQQLSKFSDQLKGAKSVILSSSSKDPCRDNLMMYNCAEYWKQVYPWAMSSRTQLFYKYQQQSKLPLVQYIMFNSSAQDYQRVNIPKACQLYESMGCSSVLSVTLRQRSSFGWVKSLNKTRDDMENYLGLFNTTLDYVVYYAQTRIMPCFFTGHIIAFFTAILAAVNVLYQFRRRLIQMRQGNNVYKEIMDKSGPATFSSTSTPTLGGMVLATAFAQYYVWAYLIFVSLAVITSERFYILIYQAQFIWIIMEVIIAFLLIKVVLEAYIGKKIIFQGTGDMGHPVFWTWYSTWLVLVNLLKGLLAGIIRMGQMIALLIVQIGVMDRSNFPEGMESTDPAFVAFLSTLNFHHRYRNPLFTAFAYKYEVTKKETEAQASAKQDEEKVVIEPTSSACKTRRRWLLAHTLHCNPNIIRYASESVGDAEPEATEIRGARPAAPNFTSAGFSTIQNSNNHESGNHRAGAHAI